MGPLAEISLFTGLAGFTLGLRLAGVPVRTACYVEADPYRREAIGARIRDGLLDDAPIWDDIRTFDGRPWRGLVDIITAGFPCQPTSGAGKRLGAADPRDRWPDTARVLREVGPRFVLLENPPGILLARRGTAPYAARVLGELAEAGYDAVWDSVSAAVAGAPHIRLRWWCLAWDAHGLGREVEAAELHPSVGADAHTNGTGVLSDAHGEPLRQQPGRAGRTGWQGAPRPGDDGPAGAMAHPDGLGRRRGTGVPEATGEARQFPAQGDGAWWSPEPPVCGVAHGVPHRVERLRALGDSLVPAVVAEFLRRAGWTG